MLAVCAACSPTLDWREVRTEGFAASALLPCKPNRSTRAVVLAGQTVQMSLLACRADDWTWAVAAADVPEPGRVGPALHALRDGAVANLQGHVLALEAAKVRGATPHAAAAGLRISGRRPDGTPTHGRVAVFSHGTQVFQATVLGRKPPAETADTFFDSLRVAS